MKSTFLPIALLGLAFIDICQGYLVSYKINLFSKYALRMASDETTKNTGSSNVMNRISSLFSAENIVAAAPETSSDLSFLPDSFEDAVERAAKCTLKSIRSGLTRVRIDFDTTIGDMTYTSLKSTLPMIKRYSTSISKMLDLYPIAFKPSKPVEGEEVNEMEEVDYQLSPRTLRIFFPDMGAAVLARRDWKMGSNGTQVAACVYTANIQNDEIAKTDKAIIILCPLYSEADYVARLVDACIERNIPCIMVNPNLINGDQGLGVRARNLKNNLINTFNTAYKLKTMKKGAVVREWPSSYSVWNEDSASPDGYSILQSYRSDPSYELLDELYDKANPEPNQKNQEPSVATAVFKEVSGFFKGLSRL